MFQKAWINRRLSDRSLTPPEGESLELFRQKYEEIQGALDMMPAEMKEEYLEAVQKCPSVVESESDPLMFLRREDFNAWAAALRLTLYWTTRKSLFGDRAFLPLTLDGTGALTGEDIDQLRAGFRAILPNDKEGRTVSLWGVDPLIIRSNLR